MIQRHLTWSIHRTPGVLQPHSRRIHYNDVIMGTVASQITSLTSVYSTVYSGTDRRKHQSSASLACVWGNSPVNSPHKWPVTRKMFPFDDVIMSLSLYRLVCFLVNRNYVCVFYHFATLNDAGRWNSSWKETRIRLSYIVNTGAQAAHGARTSTVMILTLISRTI